MAALRAELLADLTGEVVEVGAGNGMNFARYPRAVTGVVAVEPEPRLRGLATAAARSAPRPVTVVAGTANRLPLPDHSVDAAVLCLVMCSLDDRPAALAELARVLRPGGTLRFLEHTIADTPGLRRVQRLADATVWPLLVGGCHTATDPVAAITAAGFEVIAVRRLRFPEGRFTQPSSPHVLGTARLSGASDAAARRATTAVHPMCLARAERADLADLLSTLTPAQWEAPSLCHGWRVRDVVAHMFSYEELGVAGLVGRFVRGGLLPDRVNAVGVAHYAGRSTDDLLALVQDHLRPRGLTAGFGGRIALTDGLIHHQDIRRPLGLPRDIPAERLRCALDFARTAPTIGAATRRELTLVATDLDWTAGRGPTVEGPAESLLMALAGRPDSASELAGPGQATLALRISR